MGLSSPGTNHNSLATNTAHIRHAGCEGAVMQPNGQKNILLIEDDLMVRQALGQALTTENYQVVQAANRHEALHEVGQRLIDIVLLDLNPRTENGWETLQRITALQPHLPVVAMTARPEHEPDSRSRAVDVILEKPLNLSVLLRVLNELTSQTPTRRRSHRSDRSQ